MILKDNTKYFSSSENLEDFLKLQNIANRNISDLLANKDNKLLIYPHSFYECEDEVGKQVLVSLNTKWNGNKCVNAALETSNIAGFIGINGLSISIQSRFSESDREDFFLHYMLQKVLCINLINLMHGTTNESVFDFLLYLFPKLFNESLSQGIYKEYQRNEYNDANIRGPIDISRQIKLNLPFNSRIAYHTREFSHDNHITELIRHTIEYMAQTSLGRAILENDMETRSNVNLIKQVTPRYKRQDRENIIISNLKPVIHPFYSRYTYLQKLCLRILKHEKIKYGLKKDKIYGVLFDISYLWEEYLATILTKQGFVHPNNRKKIGRIYLAKKNSFPRYPDFYREADNIIIDAKYKKVIDTREDINQIITYLFRLKGKYGIFIQPTNLAFEEKCYDLFGYGEKNAAQVKIYKYPIPQSVKNYKEFITEISKSETFFKDLYHIRPNM